MRGRAFAVCIALLGAMAAAQANNIYWDGEGATNDWGLAANWYDATTSTNDVPPGAADVAYVGSSMLTPATADMASGSHQLYELELGDGVGRNGTLTVSGATTSFRLDYLNLGLAGGGGTVTQSGGTVTVNVEAVVGLDSTGTGTYNLSGGLLEAPDGALRVGDWGSSQGTFNHTGGTVQSEYVSLGWDPASQGTYNLGGTAVLDVSSAVNPAWSEFQVGDGHGTGFLNQNGGALQGNGTLCVGEWGTGTYNYNGGVLTVEHMRIGDYYNGTGTGNGTVNVNTDLNYGGAAALSAGGTVNVPGGVTFTLDAGGTFDMQGGQVTGGGTLVVDGGATLAYTDGDLAPALVDVRPGGELAVTDTTWRCATHVQVDSGAVTGGVGRVYIDNGGVLDLVDSTVDLRQLFVGDYGTGTVTQTRGTVTVSEYMAVGFSWGDGSDPTLAGAGTYHLINGLLDNSAVDVYIGDSNHGQGTLNQDGGTHLANSVTLAYDAGTTGTYNLTDGSLTTDSVAVGLGGNATFNHSGGTVQTEYIGLGWDPGTQGTYNLSGTAVLDVSSAVDPAWSEFQVGDGSGTGVLNQSGGTLQGNGTLFVGAWGPGTYNYTGGTLTVDAFWIDWLGTVNVDTDLTYGGHLTMYDGGSLNVAASHAMTNDGGLYEMTGGLADVAAGATLKMQNGGRTEMVGGHVTGDGTAAADAGGTLYYSSGTLDPQLIEVRPGGTLTLGDEWRMTTELRVNGGDVDQENNWGALNVDGGGVANVLSGTVTTEYLYVGDTGTGTMNQTGGTVTAVQYMSVGYAWGDGSDPMLAGTGTYNLSGGVLDSSTASVFVGDSYYGQGTIDQTGGAHLADYIALGYAPTTVGIYNLTGGSLTASYLNVGDGGTGTFTLAGGTLEGVGGLIDITIGYEPEAEGTFRGYGTVTSTGTLDNSGRVIADGYGADRVLDFSGFSVVTNGWDNPLGGSKGWFAQNGGSLLLPPLDVIGDDDYTWGEDPGDPTLDLVNSLRITMFSVSSPGSLSIRLLANDHPDLPSGTEGIIVGLWDLEPDPTLGFGEGDITVRYDDALAWTMGILEDDLALYHFTDGQWYDITSGLDTANHLITGHWDVLSLFAVGSNIHLRQEGAIPEPATVALLGLGLAALLRRRRH